MQRVVEQLKNQPISFRLLQRVVPRHTKVILYDDLPDTTLDKIFGKKKCLIILYMMNHNKKAVGHYSTIIRHKTTYEYFSSYGFSPEAELHMTHNSGKLLKLLGKQYIRSGAKLQNLVHSNTCARWAYARCMLHEVPLQVFVKKYSSKMSVSQPDDLVILSTLFVFDKK